MDVADQLAQYEACMISHRVRDLAEELKACLSKRGESFDLQEARCRATEIARLLARLPYKTP